MKISKYRIQTNDFEKLTNHLKNQFEFDYENHSDDMCVLASEEYYFRNGSTQLNMVIIKKSNATILIDIVAGAGGSGIFNINWWSEKEFVKKIQRIIDGYANVNHLTLNELNQSGNLTENSRKKLI